MKLSFLIAKMYVAVEQNNFHEAIKLNEQITRILETYKKAC